MFSECYDQQLFCLNFHEEYFPKCTRRRHLLNILIFFMVGRGTRSLSVPPDLKSEAAKLSNREKSQLGMKLILNSLSLFQASTTPDVRLPSKAESFSFLLSTKLALCIKRRVLIWCSCGGCILVLDVYERRAARQTRPIWRASTTPQRLFGIWESLKSQVWHSKFRLSNPAKNSTNTLDSNFTVTQSIRSCQVFYFIPVLFVSILPGERSLYF